MNARDELAALIEKNPGTHYRELARMSSYSASNVRHHLSMLVKRGDIKEIKEGKNLRYYPAAFSGGDAKLMSLLRQRSIRRILSLIAAKQCTNKELIAGLQLSPATISFHVKKLTEHRIITKKHYYELLVDKKELIRLIRDYKETFFDTLIDNMAELWDL